MPQRRAPAPQEHITKALHRPCSSLTEQPDRLRDHLKPEHQPTAQRQRRSNLWAGAYSVICHIDLGDQLTLRVDLDTRHRVAGWKAKIGLLRLAIPSLDLLRAIGRCDP